MAVVCGPAAAYHPSRRDEVAQAIADSVQRAAAQAEVALPLAGLAVGMAGLGHPQHRRSFAKTVAALGLSRTVVVTHDAEIALWGAFGSGAGIIVIAGTGAIAYGRSADGQEVRAGGWGREIDDEGGGWWLGREAMRAVMRAWDGRGPETMLAGLVLEATGCTRPPDLVDWVRQAARTPRDIAELALAVDEAARQGDAVAQGLVRAAARALAELLAACERALASGEASRRAALTGGLFSRCPTVRDALSQAVRRVLPDVELCRPRLPAVMGALVKMWAEMHGSIPDEAMKALEQAARELPGDWGYE